MSEHNHTGLDEAASVASNTMQAVRTGKAISAAAKGAAAGGPYGAAIGAALSARKHIGKIAVAALVLLALPLLFILLLPGLAFGSLTDSGASGTSGQPILVMAKTGAIPRLAERKEYGYEEQMGVCRQEGSGRPAGRAAAPGRGGLP